MKTLGRFLCWLGFHKLDESRWSEKEIWGKDTFQTNCCVRCDEYTYKHNGKRRSFRRILRKIR